jgi:hypothetical protein
MTVKKTFSTLYNYIPRSKLNDLLKELALLNFSIKKNEQVDTNILF